MTRIIELADGAGALEVSKVDPQIVADLAELQEQKEAQFARMRADGFEIHEDFYTDEDGHHIITRIVTPDGQHITLRDGVPEEQGE